MKGLMLPKRAFLDVARTRSVKAARRRLPIIGEAIVARLISRSDCAEGGGNKIFGYCFFPEASNCLR